MVFLLLLRRPHDRPAETNYSAIIALFEVHSQLFFFPQGFFPLIFSVASTVIAEHLEHPAAGSIPIASLFAGLPPWATGSSPQHREMGNALYGPCTSARVKRRTGQLICCSRLSCDSGREQCWSTTTLRDGFGTDSGDNVQVMNSNVVALREAQESRMTQREEVRVLTDAQCVDCVAFLARRSRAYQLSKCEIICWSREIRRL